MLASWATLLHRYCSQDDILIGLPVVGRSSTESFDIVGLCINTIPLRLRVAPETTFTELVHQTQDRLLEATEHGRIAFDDILASVTTETMARTPSQPLYNVGFAMQSPAMFTLHLPGLSIQPLQVETGASIDDLALECWRSDGVIAGFIEYRTNLFTPRFIERMLRHFERLLLGGIADPTCTLAHLPLLTMSETERLLRHWNQTQLPLSSTRLVSDYLVDQARQRPKAPAVVAITPAGMLYLSYGELFARSTELASDLQDAGVGIGVPVALLIDRSIAWTVAQAATLFAGGFFILIDPGLPAERVHTILSEARPAVLLTTESLFAAVGSSILPTPDASDQPASYRPTSVFYLEPYSGAVVRKDVSPIYSPSVAAEWAQSTPSHYTTRAQSIRQIPILLPSPQPPHTQYRGQPRLILPTVCLPQALPVHQKASVSLTAAS